MTSSLKAAVDIGTSQIRLAVVEVDQNGTTRLLAYGLDNSGGLKNGIIENTEEVKNRIIECMSKVELSYKVKISDVVSALPGITVNETTSVAGFEQLVQSLNNSSLNLKKVYLKNHMAANSILTIEEKSNSVLVIDIGAGTTSFSFYVSGKLLKALTIPIAGDSITSDLTFALRTSNALAEKIKTELCNVSDLNSFEFTIPALSSGPERKLSAATALQIIEPRITEIFELISHAKKELGSDGDQIQSVVLTGGTALTPTISKICSDVFGLETRIGSPDWGFSVPVELKSPRTSVLAGLIQSIN